jgi:hypothetical protein
MLIIRNLIRPSNKTNLERIEDFPFAKIETIGVKFIDKIKNFCDKFKIKMDNFVYQVSNTSPTTSKIKVEILKIISCIL